MLTPSAFDTGIAHTARVRPDRYGSDDTPDGKATAEMLATAMGLPIERPELPNVEAWYRRLAKRPAYRDHVMRHFGTNPAEWAALEKACASEGVL